MKQTAIKFADSTWNPIRGCQHAGDDCLNCWAERIAGRYAKRGETYYTIAKMVNDKPRWTGKVQIVEDKFYDPLLWQDQVADNFRPGRAARVIKTVQVASMSDLFYSKVTDEIRDHAFGVIAQSGTITFQVQTKYAEEMHAYFTHPKVWARIERATRKIYKAYNGKAYPSKGHLKGPLRNTWLGVSISDQKTADERISILQKIPAAMRYVQAAPLLGDITLKKYLTGRKRLGWVIAGGESGEDARPCRPAWMRALRDECQESKTPFFMHQWGAWLPVNTDQLKEHCGPNSVLYVWPDGEMSVNLEKSDIRTMQSFGTLLDGVEWTEVPKV